MSTLIGIYLLVHLSVTLVTAFNRSRIHRYYYRPKGALPFPRSFVRSIIGTQTFLQSIVIIASVAVTLYTLDFVTSY